MEAQTKIKHVIGEVQNDALRFGIHGVKSDIVGSHPLETLCQSAKKIEEDIKRRYIATTYGTAFPLKMDLDRQILSRFQRPTGAIPSSVVGLEGMTGGLEDFGFEHYLNDAREVQEEIENFMGAGKSKRAKKKKKKKDHDSLKEGEELMEESKEADEDDVYFIFSGDEDCSKGMKKWITEYHQSRPGLKVLQQRIDEFITDHEAKLEQERKEREACAAEGGWTVVVHHKGRKKTTDSENGIVVGSVAQAAVEDKLAKRKKNEVGLDFYRFQRREAQRNEIMMLQSKFEQDRKRIQQLRAARKFRPY